MSQPRHLLAYLVEHENGYVTGRLVQRWLDPFSYRPHVAWGPSLEAVRADLLDQLARRRDDGLPLAPLLWLEEPQLETLRLDAHPLTHSGKSRLVGARTAPVRLAYALAPNEDGFLLVVPRFNWVLEVEKAELGATMIRHHWYALLAGAEGSDFLGTLPLGAESLVAWRLPGELRRTAGADREPEALGELGKVAEDWTRRARDGEGSSLMDFFDLDRLRWFYQREPPTSLLVVGPPGVGKTSWIRLLAQRFGQLEVPEGEEPRRFWASNADRLLAGMAWLGQWEQRCLDLVEQLAWEGHYLYLGHLAPLTERRGHSAILELFEPALADRRISLVVEATAEELELCRRRTPSALRHFRDIHLNGPTAAAMPKELAAYAERRNFPLSAGGAALACQLLDAFQRHQAFPGKACRFLDDWRRQLVEAKSPAAELEKPRTARQVVDRFCKVTGLPAELVAPRTPTTLEALQAKLAAGLVGQPEACAAAARVLARFRAGLYHPEKPLGTLFLVGPTGVGKTELAKQVARLLFGDEKRLLRFDMSEYHLPGAARRLLAVGRGVQSLAQSLRQQPLSVLLLDEIEKAHPEVFDLLLGALGEGRLTDSDGGPVDLRMAVVLLTSNLGVRRGHAPGFGGENGTGGAGVAADFHAAVRQFFRPELVNRFDEVVPFRALAEADIEKIVDLQLEKIRKRPGFTRRGIKLFLEPGARRLLARQGFDPRYGARPLLRLMEDKVLAPLAALLAEDPRRRDFKVFVSDRPPASVPVGSLVIALDPS